MHPAVLAPYFSIASRVIITNTVRKRPEFLPDVVANAVNAAVGGARYGPSPAKRLTHTPWKLGIGAALYSPIKGRLFFLYVTLVYALCFVPHPSVTLNTRKEKRLSPSPFLHTHFRKFAIIIKDLREFSPMCSRVGPLGFPTLTAETQGTISCLKQRVLIGSNARRTP